RWNRPGPGSQTFWKAGRSTGPNGCRSIRWEVGGRSKPTGSLKATDGPGERSDGACGSGVGKTEAPCTTNPGNRHRRNGNQGRGTERNRQAPHGTEPSEDSQAGHTGGCDQSHRRVGESPRRV